jgi:antitoxin CptB
MVPLSEFDDLDDLDDLGMRGRLNWRCRRGMHELDLLLQRWMDLNFETASGAQRRGFARLLELPDPELARLLLHGGLAQEPDLQALVELLRAAPPREKALPSA